MGGARERIFNALPLRCLSAIALAVRGKRLCRVEHVNRNPFGHPLTLPAMRLAQASPRKIAAGSPLPSGERSAETKRGDATPGSVGAPPNLRYAGRASTAHSGGRSNEKTHDDVDGSVACAGSHGLAGRCAKRSCQYPCPQERKPNRQTGGMQRIYRCVWLCSGLGQCVSLPLLPVRSLLISTR